MAKISKQKNKKKNPSRTIAQKAEHARKREEALKKTLPSSEWYRI